MIRFLLSLLAIVSLLSAADNPVPAATPPAPPAEQVLSVPEPGRFGTEPRCIPAFVAKDFGIEFGPDRLPHGVQA